MILHFTRRTNTTIRCSSTNNLWIHIIMRVVEPDSYIVVLSSHIPLSLNHLLEKHSNTLSRKQCHYHSRSIKIKSIIPCHLYTASRWNSVFPRLEPCRWTESRIPGLGPFYRTSSKDFFRDLPRESYIPQVPFWRQPLDFSWNTLDFELFLLSCFPPSEKISLCQ